MNGMPGWLLAASGLVGAVIGSIVVGVFGNLITPAIRTVGISFFMRSIYVGRVRDSHLGSWAIR
jgi:uncharacterized membrane protein YjjB (DUF3815 family)